VETLAKLKYELQHDRALTPILDDGQPDVKGYNDELAALESPTWFNVPWLYAECYLYRYGHIWMLLGATIDSSQTYEYYIYPFDSLEII
jgi:hypothetical protein